jgi:hypothetical protein
VTTSSLEDCQINELPWLLDRGARLSATEYPMMPGPDRGDGWGICGELPLRTFGWEATAGRVEAEYPGEPVTPVYHADGARYFARSEVVVRYSAAETASTVACVAEPQLVGG